MKTKRVLDHNNLPSRLPIWPTATAAIALDYWHAPQWLWGALGLFFLFGWLACIHNMLNDEKVDLLNNEKK